ncbi:hypothetical protein SAMN03159341_106303 [Paenibacillus sp. 1_12]|uniref:hypothetical protein n=1 Tax=Paenibacillus sp. 1_12 TaxID=1566278 RepID=UPI0008E69358|nr:hypothetical protein [Paenibacillus sp. 1_12]SFL48592.1 hypothetical protein SAMN03159341_106303 [Paenibacillus sp. 1_12]
MYQNNQQNAYQNQFGASNAGSQYRGIETKYQPIGNVQSQYNQSLGLGNANNFQNSNSYNNQYANNRSQGQDEFHTTNYRGNQQGHDAYLRSDSTQTAQSQFGMGTGYNNQASYGNMNNNALYGYQNQYSSNQTQSPDSFHTSSYVGNQQGHDAYLRSDSTQTAQSQYGIGANSGINSYNMGNSSQYSNQQNNQYQNQNQQNQAYNQSQNPQSYHTTNYRGNQQGHDAYLRSDSTQPAQSQYSQSSNSFNRYQF